MSVNLPTMFIAPTTRATSGRGESYADTVPAIRACRVLTTFHPRDCTRKQLDTILSGMVDGYNAENTSTPDALSHVLRLRKGESTALANFGRFYMAHGKVAPANADRLRALHAGGQVSAADQRDPVVASILSGDNAHVGHDDGTGKATAPDRSASGVLTPAGAAKIRKANADK